MKIFGDFTKSDVNAPPEEIKLTNLLHAVVPAAVMFAGWLGLYVYLFGFILAQIIQLYDDSSLKATVDTIKDSVITLVSTATVVVVISATGLVWPFWIWQGFLGIVILTGLLYLDQILRK